MSSNRALLLLTLTLGSLCTALYFFTQQRTAGPQLEAIVKMIDGLSQYNRNGISQNYVQEQCLTVRFVSPNHPDKNVFLVESANKSRLDYRSLCSVESWARQNPSLDVWYLVTTNCTDDSDSLLSRLLSIYHNLHLAQLPVNELMNGTPLEKLYKSDLWRTKSKWPATDLSDMVRVLCMLHYGGIYSDSDIICIRPFSLPLNALGFESNKKVNNALMSFTKGHPFLSRLILDMKKNYKPGVWAAIGPNSVTRVLKQWCSEAAQQFNRSYTPYQCADITLYPMNYFYPFSWGGHKNYFKDNGGKNFDKDFNSSYTLHMFDHSTKVLAVRMDGNSIYEHATRNYCPVTYYHATRRSSFF